MKTIKPTTTENITEITSNFGMDGAVDFVCLTDGRIVKITTADDEVTPRVEVFANAEDASFGENVLATA